MTRRVTRVIPEIEAKLAEAIGTSPSMVRFHACHLALELELGRRLTSKEYSSLWGYVYEVHRKPKPRAKPRKEMLI